MGQPGAQELTVLEVHPAGGGDTALRVEGAGGVHVDGVGGVDGVAKGDPDGRHRAWFVEGG